ncbi:MAG: hypothetical protein FWC51_04690 [Proteobacteria bacterium]|nr:hypothetical protein [Pseudomonadota bacterium]
MPTVKKIKTEKHTPKKTITNWLWGAPVKFMALMMLLLTAIIVVAGTIAYSVQHNNPGAPIAVPSYFAPLMIALMVLAAIYGIYKMVKWLPFENVDRHSFVALSIATTIASVLILLGFFGFSILMGMITGGMVTPGQFIGFFILKLAYTSPTLLLILWIVVMAAVLFLLGFSLSARYVAEYWRARDAGVSRLKYWLNFPFGWAFLLYPLQFLADDKKKSQSVQIKSKWFATFTNWIAHSAFNMFALFIVLPYVLIAIFTPSSAIMSLCIGLIPVVVFFAVWAIVGTKKLIAALPKWFSTLTIVLNILAIAAYIVFEATYAKSAQPAAAALQNAAQPQVVQQQ